MCFWSCGGCGEVRGCVVCLGVGLRVEIGVLVMFEFGEFWDGVGSVEGK